MDECKGHGRSKPIRAPDTDFVTDEQANRGTVRRNSEEVPVRDSNMEEKEFVVLRSHWSSTGTVVGLSRWARVVLLGAAHGHALLLVFSQPIGDNVRKPSMIRPSSYNLHLVD